MPKCKQCKGNGRFWKSVNGFLTPFPCYKCKVAKSRVANPKAELNPVSLQN